MSDGPSDKAFSEPAPEQPRIRRQPDGPTTSAPQPAHSEPQTSIIRRHPTGEIPVADPQTNYIPRATPVAVGSSRPKPANPKAAIATAVVSIFAGWATAVIATDLITGWWKSDPLFCVAIGFLTAVSAAASISGLIALLLRRRMARLLIVVGAVVALLIFAGLFVAGAKLSPVVYAIPALPVVTILLALLPATGRWARAG
ncbi:hypothetical protein [Mycobacterium sp. MMS18-G62]